VVFLGNSPDDLKRSDPKPKDKAKGKRKALYELLKGF